MHPGIDIDFTTRNLSDLENQLMRSLQPTEPCASEQSDDDANGSHSYVAHKMMIFMLQQKLNSLESTNQQLKMENDKLKAIQSQHEETIHKLQQQQQISDTQTATTTVPHSITMPDLQSKLIEQCSAQNNSMLIALQTMYEAHLVKLESRITELSKRVIHCGEIHQEQISRLKQEAEKWKSKYLCLKEKCKQILQARKLESQTAIAKKQQQPDRKHEHWQIVSFVAIIVLLIMCALLIAWNKCVQFAKKSTSVLISRSIS